MITKLTVRRIDNIHTGQKLYGLPNYLDIPMYSDDRSDYYVRNITGLAPTQSSYDVRPLLMTPNYRFDGIRDAIRQIVITLAYNESKHSIYEARTGLYKWFDTGVAVRLTFQVEGRSYYTDGIVKLHESNIFGEDPLSQITIECDLPYFTSVDKVEYKVENMTSLSGNYRVDPTSGFNTDIPAPLEIIYRTGYPTTRLRVYASYSGSANPIDLRDINVAVGRDIHINGIPHERDAYHKPSNSSARTSLVANLPFVYDWLYSDTVSWTFYYLIEQTGSATTPGNGFFTIRHSLLKAGL